MCPGRKTAEDTIRKLVRRFYDQFWNSRNYGAAKRIVGPHAVIRGMLSTTAEGPRGLERYADAVGIQRTAATSISAAGLFPPGSAWR